MTDEELAAVKSRAETIAGDRRLTRWAPHFTADQVLVLVAEVERLQGIIKHAGLGKPHPGKAQQIAELRRTNALLQGIIDRVRTRAESWGKWEGDDWQSAGTNILAILDGEEQS